MLELKGNMKTMSVCTITCTKIYAYVHILVCVHINLDERSEDC